jgi:hypothetical protein
LNILAIGFATPRLVRCNVCKGSGQGCATLSCDACDGYGGWQADDPRLATLAHNLAIAARLEDSFWQGAQYGRAQMGPAWATGKLSEMWRPGCGMGGGVL